MIFFVKIYGKINSRWIIHLKVIKTRRRNNAENIATALIVFAMIILAMVSVFVFKLSQKTNANYKIANHIKRAQIKYQFNV